jgi:hypothetical protein
MRERHTGDAAVEVAAVAVVDARLEVAVAVGLEQRGLVVLDPGALLELVRALPVAVVDGQSARRETGVEPELGAVLDDEVLVHRPRPVLQDRVVVAVLGLVDPRLGEVHLVAAPAGQVAQVGDDR